MKKKPDPEWIEPLEKGRLLIVTHYEEAITRVSSATASRRHQFMIEMADEVVVGFAGAGGNLEKMLHRINKPWKTIRTFTIKKSDKTSVYQSAFLYTFCRHSTRQVRGIL